MGTVSKKCMGSKKGELECGVAEANMGHVRVPVYRVVSNLLANQSALRAD